MNLSTLGASLVQLFAANPALVSAVALPFVLLLLDVLTGGIRAAKQGSFRLDMLADFAGPSLGKYLGLLMAGIFSAVMTHQGIAGGLVMIHSALAPWYLAQIASIDRNISLITGADEGLVNGIVNTALGKAFGVHLPPEGDSSNNDAGTLPPAAPVAASAQSLDQAVAATA